MSRTVEIERNTNETKVKVELNLDGGGVYHIETGVGFFDHMLAQTARHGFLDLTLKCSGDLNVDTHHTVEDAGIALGMAFAAALGDKRGISRYGSKVVPMDESLALCALDFSGRPFLSYDARFQVPRIGDLDTEMIEEFFRAFAVHSGCTLHIKLLSSGNSHHMAEAVFKAFGQAIEQAVSLDPRVKGPRSTKGVL
ncbi:MAG: imidazoleglycerol-phosphate dehydratase HisB [Clostridiales bacterium]|jgi:imidazoleglycerol-phosphate dehydratase|nr:imidazoleglycerol-phosphate dehydratase HisB [Clostridiales bacterium]